MHALIVTAHPNHDAHTHRIADQLAQGVLASGHHTVEQADLAAEGFDPRFMLSDHQRFNGEAATPPDVLAEQQRLDRADALVLVYPIYWWSFPAQLKGWIDRVFIAGWAFDEQDDRIVKRLGHLPVHLIALGAADTRTFMRRGYFGSMRNLIDHGIFDYCGAPVVTSELLLTSDEGFPESHYQRAQQWGQRIFAREESA
ncbi:NAD(P)H-dependent oxidoreductase [Pantoea anthophila]|uniref:NAD(P)H-dependent oxidoreductase n=1 Tax=Pantoea anthophila TaxID=470931 RepID=UPI002DB6F9F3|nr:NAD(P)H-dependent oxidoreductase [Pantoea anthophila]MEB5705877.1 NAD(P)H-dependent oxidoreductase [Pantoea anthophila]MEB6516788.1 NAD(P)H-dependent oxidoreductase [Pantoea anthophila]